MVEKRFYTTQQWDAIPHKDSPFKDENFEKYFVKKSLDKQVGGDHYKTRTIQPIDYIRANGLTWEEGNVVKLITRHRKKGGRLDIEKAIHYLELLLEWEYDKEDGGESTNS